MTVSRAFESAGNVANSKPEPTSRREQMVLSASRKLEAEGRALVIREAVMAFVNDCYELDSMGHFVNVDPVSFRILIPTPWGRKGRKQWRLPWMEAEVLRTLMLRAKGGPVAYDSPTWFLAVGDCPTLEDALAWVNRSGFSADTWTRGYRLWQQGQPRWKRTHAQFLFKNQ